MRVFGGRVDFSAGMCYNKNVEINSILPEESTEQNSNSSSLSGALLDAAITAATTTCDLYFSVAGARNRIKPLYKSEAERIIAVYHQHRKAAKDAASQSQVIVQQAAPACDDPSEQLKSWQASKKWASSARKNSTVKRPICWQRCDKPKP